MKKRLTKLLEKNKRPLFLALGNEMRGDDGIGLFIGKKLKEEFNVILGEKNPELKLKQIKSFRPDLLVIIDAVKKNEKLGDVIFTDASDFKPKKISSHRMPIPIFVDLLKEELKELKVFLIGINISNTSTGEEMTEEVKETGELLVEILKEVKNQISN